MVDKVRTIKKAEAKFGAILPITGKQALTDCFFGLRGEMFFQFRTKEDRKIHVIKAVAWQPSSKQTWNAIYTMLTQPLFIRTLFGFPRARQLMGNGLVFL